MFKSFQSWHTADSQLGSMSTKTRVAEDDTSTKEKLKSRSHVPGTARNNRHLHFSFLNSAGTSRALRPPPLQFPLPFPILSEEARFDFCMKLPISRHVTICTLMSLFLAPEAAFLPWTAHLWWTIQQRRSKFKEIPLTIHRRCLNLRCEATTPSRSDDANHGDSHCF